MHIAPFDNRNQPIVDIDDTHITVDGNHYLAGETLFFDVEIVEIIKA